MVKLFPFANNSLRKGSFWIGVEELPANSSSYVILTNKSGI